MGLSAESESLPSCSWVIIATKAVNFDFSSLYLRQMSDQNVPNNLKHLQVVKCSLLFWTKPGIKQKVQVFSGTGQSI